MQNKPLLFFLTFFLFFSFLLSVPCTSDNCKIENNCRCASKSIPGGLTKDEIPQFVFFTLDDSVYEEQYKVVENLDFILRDNSIKDALGCNVHLSYYVRQLGTLYIILYINFWSSYF